MALQMLDDLYRVIETSEELDYDTQEAIETLQNSLHAFRHVNLFFVSSLLGCGGGGRGESGVPVSTTSYSPPPPPPPPPPTSFWVVA